MQKKNIIWTGFAVLICLNVIAWTAVYNFSQPGLLEVTFFDVGQGDSIFIETPAGHQILIDGGPDKGILQKLSQEMGFYDRDIDLIILTHPEKDHMAGLIEVLKNYDVKYILWTGIIRDTAEYQEWIKVIEQEQKQGAQIKIAQAGQKMMTTRSDLVILYPFESLLNQEFEDSNNTSIVAKLSFGQNSFLFTGDIYDSIEKQLIDNEIDLNSSVLKIAHHGSKTSTSQEFVKNVSPEIAVIQLGAKNSYGHPHKQVLQTLENYNVQILRTDEKGDIKIISDGYKIF